MVLETMRESIDLLTLIPLMFALGVLSSFSPCFFPLFPLFLAYVANVENDVRKGVIAGFTCTLGIASSFMVYGMLASFLAFPLLKYGTPLRFVFGGFIVFLGVSMLTRLRRVFTKLRPPKRLLEVKGVLGTFVLGLSYTLIAAPCAMPIFLSAILLAIIPGNFLVTVANLVIFGFGAGTPFILSSLLITSTRDFVGRRYRSVAPLFEFGPALVLILTGLLLLFSALGLIPYFI